MGKRFTVISKAGEGNINTAKEEKPRFTVISKANSNSEKSILPSPTEMFKKMTLSPDPAVKQAVSAAQNGKSFASPNILAQNVYSINKQVNDAVKEVGGEKFSGLTVEETKKLLDEAKSNWEKGKKAYDEEYTLLEKGLNLIGGMSYESFEKDPYNAELEKAYYDKLNTEYILKNGVFTDNGLDYAATIKKLEKEKKEYEDKGSAKDKSALTFKKIGGTQNSLLNTDSEFVNQVEMLDKQIEYMKKDYGSGDYLSDNFKVGLKSAVYSPMAVVDATLGNFTSLFVEDKDNPFRKWNNYYQNDIEKTAIRAAKAASLTSYDDTNKLGSLTFQTAGQLVPTILGGWLFEFLGAAEGVKTGVDAVKLAADLGTTSKTAKLLLKTSTAIQSTVNNPMFYTSAMTEMGNTYNEAVGSGSDPWTASAVAMGVGLVNGYIEVAGGVEALPNKLSSNSTVNDVAEALLKTPFEELGEEILQGRVSNLAAKLTYNKEMAWSDVANPYDMAKEGLGGFIGGLMGGGFGLTVNTILNAASNSEYKKIGSEVIANKSINTQELVDYGKKSTNNEVRQIANTNNIGEIEIGKLYQYALRDMSVRFENLATIKQANEQLADIVRNEPETIINLAKREYVVKVNELTEDYNISDNAIDRYANEKIKSNVDAKTVDGGSETDYNGVETSADENTSSVFAEDDIEQGADGELNELREQTGFTEPSDREIYEPPTKQEELDALLGKPKNAKQRHIEKVSDKFGIKIIWSDEVSRGKYVPSTKSIVLNPNIRTAEMYNFVFKHEFTHYLEGKQGYTDFKNYVFKKSALFEKWVRERLDKNGIDSTGSREKIIKRLTQIQYEAYKNSDEMSKVMRDRFTMNDAEEEVLADFVGERLLGTGGQLEETLDMLSDINRKHRGIFQKIRDFVRDMINRFKGDKTFKGLVSDLEYLNERLKRVAESDNKKISDNETEKYSIVALENGNTYVKASRNVIKGDDISEWRKQITNFFNDLLDGEKSLDINTIDGDVLTITKSETANKARDNHKYENGENVRMSDDEFRVKLNAEAHIDEIAETSIDNKNKTVDTKSHGFAKDGFTYRTAYFQDFDGEYYRLILSVGNNETVATIYNVGKINKDSLPSHTKIVAVVGSKPLGKLSNDSILNQNEEVKKNISENDTKTIKSLSERVSDDELLNVEDLIDVVKSVGGEVDNNGYITLYHRTTEQAKEKILSSGKMTAKEDGIFFSTKKDGQAIGYGDSVIEMHIPAEKLILDDIFDDEAHLRYPLENRNSVLNVSEYTNFENDTDKNSIAVLSADELLDKYDRGEITREEYLKQTDSMTRRAALQYVQEWERENGAILSSQKRLEAEREKAVELEREEQQMLKDRESNIWAIRRTVRKLDRALRTNTNSKHIPEAYKNVVRGVCKLFVDNDKATFEHKDLADIYSYYVEMKGDGETIPDAPQYDPFIDELLQSLTKTLSGRKLTELNSLELGYVRAVINALNYTVDHEAQVFIDGKKEKYEEVGRAALNDIENANPNKLIGALQNELATELREYLYEGNMLPEYFFKRLGPTFEKIFNDLIDGMNKWARNMEISKDFWSNTKSKYDYDGWKNDTVSFKTELGNDITITIEQAMQLVATAQRERSNNIQKPNHLSIGGVVIDFKYIKKAIKSHIKRKISKSDLTTIWNNVNGKAIQISFNDVEVVSRMLSSNQKGYIKDVVDFLSTQCAAWGNEVTMGQYGYRQFNESNYFPYVSSKLFLETDPARNDNTIIRRASFTHALQKNANNPLLLTSFTDIAAQHIESMCNFNAMTMPLETLNKVLNYQTEAIKGVKTGQSVKQAIENKFGTGAAECMQNLINDLNTGVRGDQRDRFSNKMISLYKKNAVLANLSVIIQQPFAIIRAIADINVKYFAKAYKYRSKNNYEECKQYAPAAIIKQMGRFDTGVGVNNTAWMTGEKTIRDKADDFFGWGAGKADEIAWSFLWSSVKAEIADTTDLKVGSDEFLTKAGERFTELVNKTQVYDSVLTKSQNMRNKGLAGSITSFMSEPTVALNMVVNSFLDFTEGKISGKKFARVITAVVAAEIVTSMAKSLAYTARDDDEDKSFIEKYLKNLVSNSLSDVNLAGKIPYVRDIITLWEGYNIDRPDAELLADLVKAVKMLSNENKSWDEKARSISEALAALYGVPLKNILRDIEATYKTVKGFVLGENKTDVAGLEFAIGEGLGIIKNTSDKYSALAKAGENGNEEKYDRMYDNLLEAGKDEGDIKSGIKNYYRTDKDVKKEGSKLFSDLEDNKTFKSLKKEDKSKLEKDIISSLATEKTVSAMVREPDVFDELYEALRNNKNLYNQKKKELMANGMSESLIDDGIEAARISYMKSIGIDVNEYLLYKIATSKKYADTNNSGGVSKSEKTAAINKMDLDENAKRFFNGSYK